MNKENTTFDVVIIGGSYAGLSAAMALGRALRNVLVIDSGKPCNAQTPHSHNFITQDGEAPAAIAAKAKEQVMQYPTVQFLNDTAVAVTGENSNFSVSTSAGLTIHAKKLLFATGVKDIMPAIEGFAPCWGISVIHCPYCHGYEYKSQPTGILMNGDMAIDMAELIENWTSQLTIFTNGKSTISNSRLEQFLTLSQVQVVEKEIRSFQHIGGKLQYIEFADGSTQTLDALYARPAFIQQSNIPELLGCQFTEAGYLVVNDMQQTNIPGVYAAGDNITMRRAVSGAVATGGFAGAIINHELIADKFGRH